MSISQPAELYRFLVTPGVEVQNMLFANDDVVWKSWQYSADERVPTLRHTNEVIDAYVTTRGRIYLYGFLDKLQEKAIYCDTDCDIRRARADLRTHANKDGGQFGADAVRIKKG